MISAFKKLPLLLGSGRQTALLYIESYLYLGWARFRLRFTPFHKIAPALGIYMAETEFYCPPEHRRILGSVHSAVHIISRYTFWESKCLVKAIAAMKMLERRGIGSTLYLGTRKDEQGMMIAHAWLRSGNYYVSGAEEMELFTVTGKFGRTIQN